MLANIKRFPRGDLTFVGERGPFKVGVSGLGSVWHAQCMPSWILSLNIPLPQRISTICFALASDICYLIFIGCVTVWFDLTNYMLLVIGHVRSGSFEVAWQNTFSYVMKGDKNNKMIKLRTFLRHSCGVWWFYSKSSLNTLYLITVKTTSQVNPSNNIQSNVFIVDKTNW